MSGDVDIGPDVDDALFAAAFELAAEGGWRRARMVDIAARAGVSADQARARFRCKISLLNSFAARVDAAVETAAGGGGDLTPRDRLFDLLMARFDAMTPHRAGIVAILRALPTMPLTTIAGGPNLLTAMRATLTLADIGHDGVAGILRTKGLAAVYLSALRTWLDDDSADLSATMKALDRGLARAEEIALSIGLARPATASE
ncbi:MAG: TetR family transcriptional regulator [Pseudomonadota bacterium]|nr:TetR family transcriptional regulator [Pseudomonadota bacterium]MEC8675911.1 TetR family transcriptional regulator [Pseudomonadota bacterium]